MGATGKYDPKRVQIILDALKSGMTARKACDLAGVTESTYYAWIKSKSEFSEALKRADAEGIYKSLAVIRREAESGQWAAAAWLLERRWREDYGRTPVETGTADGDVTIIIKRRGDTEEG